MCPGPVWNSGKALEGTCSVSPGDAQVLSDLRQKVGVRADEIVPMEIGPGLPSATVPVGRKTSAAFPQQTATTFGEMGVKWRLGSGTAGDIGSQ